MTGFGDLVRRQRKAAGLTRAELAALTGLSIRPICDLERGATAAPRRSSRRLLDKVLNLSEGRGGDSGEVSERVTPRRCRPRCGTSSDDRPSWPH